MIDKNNDIVGLFKSEVESFEMVPPEESWALLDLELQGKKVELYKKKASRFKLLSLLLFLLLLSTTLWQFFFSKQEAKSGYAWHLINRNAPKNNLPVLFADANSIKTVNKKQINKQDKNSVIKSGYQTTQSISKHLESTLKKANKNIASVTGREYRQSITNKTKENSSVDVPSTIESVQTQNGDNKPLTVNQNMPVSKNKIGYLTTDTMMLPVNDISGAGNSVSIKEDKKEIENNTIIDSAIAKSNSQDSRFTAFLFFSPDYAQRSLVDNNNADNQNEGDYNQRESPNFSFTTGAKCAYAINSRWGLQAGITYSSLSQNIKPILVFAKNGDDGHPHYALPTSYGMVELPNSSASALNLGDSTYLSENSKQVIQFINLPLLATYRLYGKTLSYYLIAGTSLNFAVSEKVKVDEKGIWENTNKINGLKQFNQSLVIGAGIEYAPKNRLRLRIEPIFKRDISPINKNTAVSAYPYSFGLSFCLGYCFR